MKYNEYEVKMDNKTFQIVVDLTKNCGECEEYHYTVFVWDEANKTWCNAGVSGVGLTPLHAFFIGYSKFQGLERDVTMIGRHHTNKRPDSPTYSKEWSGVSYSPHCKNGCACPVCGERLHAEAGEHYCPRCDDFVCPAGKNHEAR